MGIDPRNLINEISIGEIIEVWFDSDSPSHHSDRSYIFKREGYRLTLLESCIKLNQMYKEPFGENTWGLDGDIVQASEIISHGVESNDN